MRKRYGKDLKVMILDLLESGQSIKQVSHDYEVHEATVRRWLRESKSGKEAFTGNGNPSLSPEQKEIRALKRALREAEMERDILKKAVSIFSKSDRKGTDS